MTVTRDEPTDEQLLTQYLVDRDQAAFREVVQRHGPLVWGVCRRVLGNLHDAEDAFQASFIVLLKRAHSIRKKQSVAGWLHQVAHRIALRARRQAAGRDRPASLQELGSLMASAASSSLPEEEVLAALSEEIARLPDGLRESVVLCYLEGLTNGQAAQRLGCPEGTIVSRLARARDKLQRRLRSRGLVLSGAAVLTGLFQGTATSAPPDWLVENLVTFAHSPASAALAATTFSAGARALAEETLRQIVWRQVVCWATAAVFLSGIAAGAWALWKPPPQSAPRAQAAVDPAALSALAGNWQAIHLDFAPGETAAERDESTRRCRWVIEGDEARLQWLWETRVVARVVPRIGPPPQTVEFSITRGPEALAGKTLHGAFEVQADRLHVRIAPERDEGPIPVQSARQAHNQRTAELGLSGLATFRRQTALEAATFGITASALHMLQGEWSLVGRTVDGKTRPVADPEQTASIDVDWIRIQQGDSFPALQGKLTLVPDEPDRRLDITEVTDTETRLRRCLYSIDGDTLHLCLAEAGRDPPRDFSGRSGDDTTVLVFKHREGTGMRANR
jgi:RNA polymerase sigma factor (sigma-70 family)